MNYQGPGIYKHYKGGEYLVLGLGLQEDTVRKPGAMVSPVSSQEVVFVVYMPLTPGSMLEDREEAFWLRYPGVFNERVIQSGTVSTRGDDVVPRFVKTRNLTINRDVLEILKKASVDVG